MFVPDDLCDLQTAEVYTRCHCDRTGRGRYVAQQTSHNTTHKSNALRCRVRPKVPYSTTLKTHRTPRTGMPRGYYTYVNERWKDGP